MLPLEYLRTARSGIRPWGGPSGSLVYLRAARSGIRPWGGPAGSCTLHTLSIPVNTSRSIARPVGAKPRPPGRVSRRGHRHPRQVHATRRRRRQPRARWPAPPRCRGPPRSAPPTPFPAPVSRRSARRRGLGADDAVSPVAVAKGHRNHLPHERTARELFHGGKRHVPWRHVGVIDAGQDELQRAALGTNDEVHPGGLATSRCSSSRDNRITSVIVATPRASSATLNIVVSGRRLA